MAHKVDNSSLCDGWMAVGRTNGQFGILLVFGSENDWEFQVLNLSGKSVCLRKEKDWDVLWFYIHQEFIVLGKLVNKGR